MLKTLQQGVKVVAKDGTLIHRTGLITGGQTSNEAAQAARWSGSKVRGWQDELDQLKEKLQGMPSLQEGRREERRLGNHAGALGRRITCLNEEVKSLRTKATDNVCRLNNSWFIRTVPPYYLLIPGL